MRRCLPLALAVMLLLSHFSRAQKASGGGGHSKTCSIRALTMRTERALFSPSIIMSLCGHCPCLSYGGAHLLGSGAGKCQGSLKETEPVPFRRHGQHNTA